MPKLPYLASELDLDLTPGVAHLLGDDVELAVRLLPALRGPQIEHIVGLRRSTADRAWSLS